MEPITCRIAETQLSHFIDMIVSDGSNDCLCGEVGHSSTTRLGYFVKSTLYLRTGNESSFSVRMYCLGTKKVVFKVLVGDSPSS